MNQPSPERKLKPLNQSKELKRIKVDPIRLKKMSRKFINYRNDESTYDRLFKKEPNRIFS
jgi:hypothetical protein